MKKSTVKKDVINKIVVEKLNPEVTIPRWMADYSIYARECLGHKDMNKEHEALCKFLQFGGNFLLVLMPRYSFKSCIVTQGLSTHMLLINPDTRILIYSDSSTKAEGFLTGIKNHYEGKATRSEYRKVFGDWIGDQWNNSQITIKQRKNYSVEPSVDTAGIETSKVGMHYDVIIFDDIVSDLNITTKAQMDKVYDCYKKALALLKPGGKVIVVGTRWHFGDAYGRMIDSGKFKTFIRDAEKEENGKLIFENVGLTRQFLADQKKEMGSFVYSCLYRNSPVDDETAMFKYKDFSFYSDIKTDDLFITATLDPAGEGEDFTAITVLGMDDNRDMYLLDVVNAHLKPNEIISEVIRLSYKWKYSILGVETNFFRGMLEKEIRLACDEHRRNPEFKLFSLVEIQAKKGAPKEVRIQALQPYHERGAIKFPGTKVEDLSKNFYELAYQMLQFPKAPHDDILDSLAYQLQISRPGGKVKTTVYPPMSPGWLEMRDYEKHLEMNKFTPRAYRKRFNFIFN